MLDKLVGLFIQSLLFTGLIHWNSPIEKKVQVNEVKSMIGSQPG
jgi:hypothetical protein